MRDLEIQEQREKLLEARAKVFSTLDRILPEVSISSIAEMGNFINRIKDADVPSDIKDFIMQQVEKKVSVESMETTW